MEIWRSSQSPQLISQFPSLYYLSLKESFNGVRSNRSIEHKNKILPNKLCALHNTFYIYQHVYKISIFSIGKLSTFIERT